MYNFSIVFKNFPNVEYCITISVQFITRIIIELEAESNKTTKQNLENKLFYGITNCKWNPLNKELIKYGKIEHDIKKKITRINQIEHHFNIVDQQLQCAMKKKMFEYYVL